MKKACIFLMGLFIATSVFSQIQIAESGQTKSNSDYRKESTLIEHLDDGYYFLLKDYECIQNKLNGEQYMIRLFLGATEDQVKQSYVTLQNWWNNAENDDYIIVTNPNGQNVCLYKYNANIYMSYGDERNCKQTRIQFGLDVTAALAGTKLRTIEQKQQFINNVAFGEIQLTGGCSFKKEFLKSLKNYQF